MIARTVAPNKSLSLAELHDFLVAVDGDFEVPLSAKKDLWELTTQLFEYGTCCIERRDGRVVAAVLGYTDHLVDERAYISVVATLPEARGQGLARALMEEFLGVCRAKGIGRCHVYTTEGNTAARALYASLGFGPAHDAEEPRPGDTHLEWVLEDVSPFNILLTSAGRRSYLVHWFQEVLAGSGKVHAANSSPISAALQVADEAVITPLIYDEGYIDFLVDYCRDHEIAMLIPLFDIDLPVIAAARERLLEVGCVPVVSDYEITQICNDKWRTFEFLRSCGLDAPRTFLTEEDACAAIEAGEIGFPLVIKPRWGMGSLGVRIAENTEELAAEYAKTLRSIEQSYLRYESAVTLDAPIIIQEMLPGEEYGLDVMSDLDGTYRHTSVKHKLAMRSGETDCAETVDNPALRSLGKSLAEGLSKFGTLRGNLDVDVFLSEERTCVLEMNVRFGGGYPFSHMAGSNLPAALVSWARGERVSDSTLCERPGILVQKDIGLMRLER